MTRKKSDLVLMKLSSYDVPQFGLFAVCEIFAYEGDDGKGKAWRIVKQLPPVNGKPQCRPLTRFVLDEPPPPQAQLSKVPNAP